MAEQKQVFRTRLVNVKIKPVGMLAFVEHIETTMQVLIDTVCDLSVSIHGGPDNDGGNVIPLRRAA